MHNQRNTFTIKKNNVHTVWGNNCLKFLDISNFLAPGTSYSGFLKAYGVQERKVFFPYEWFDDFLKLNESSLPPLGKAWYSKVKRRNVLDDVENTPDDNYEWLQQVWVEHNMNTFKDFLVWYNNLDVGPFVKAVKSLYSFYQNIDIDVFKVAVSTPGIARHMLFNTASKSGAYFTIFDEVNRDLYGTIKNNIIGGPSKIFTRHHIWFYIAYESL